MFLDNNYGNGGLVSVTIEVETKDCSMLGDAELEEMTEVCADGPNQFEIGLISKQTEEWVLCTTARENGRLKGFSFFTLERIGGTPSVIIGLASIARTSKRDTFLKAIVTEHLRRSVLAFPDEDVVMGARLNDPSGFEAFKSLTGVAPAPNGKESGEDRAWGKRLVKRYGMSSLSYDEHKFVAKGSEETACVVDHTSLKPEKFAPEVVAFFKPLNLKRGDVLIAYGWAMAEDLEKLV
ncbi:MAG: hypothetical protein CL440_05545 [Acidimicrobiaceae bacterium]|nr:hypothetical protein [Acidimicrobiaceae bacterium]